MLRSKKYQYDSKRHLSSLNRQCKGQCLNYKRDTWHKEEFEERNKDYGVEKSERWNEGLLRIILMSLILISLMKYMISIIQNS